MTNAKKKKNDNAKKVYFPDWFFLSGIVDSTDTFSGRILQILDRYDIMCKQGYCALRDKFTDRELYATASAMTGHYWSDRAELLDREILINVEDSYPSEINLETEEEKQVLVDKIKNLSYYEQIVLTELIRYFFINQKLPD